MFTTLNVLFPADLITKLARIKRPPEDEWDTLGPPIRRRHEVLACPRGETWAWRFKKAWASYFDAADACGLLADRELRGNLLGTDDDAFRGALAECNVAWFMARELGMKVTPKPDPTHDKNVDLLGEKNSLKIYVEVKAPYVPRIGRTQAGDDSDALEQCVRAAGKQAKKGRCNLVFIAPTLRIEVYADRDQLVKAVIGEPALSVFISLDPKRAPPPPEPTFLQNGKLARPRGVLNDGRFRTDLTRISAVATIETRLEADEVTHQLVIVHNPFAEVPMPEGLFLGYPQLVKRENEMVWTDRP